MFQYYVGNKIVFITAMLFLAACSSVHHENQVAENHTTWKQEMPAESADVVVKTCQNMSSSDLSALLGRHGVQIKKRVSPQIVVVEWGDDRQLDEVVQELQRSGKFCGVQKNLKSQMMEK